MMLLFFSACCGAAHSRMFTAGAGEDTAGRAVLTLESNVPGVRVMLDTISMGELPIYRKYIEPGKYVLRFIHPDYRNWFREVIVETVEVSPSENLHRRVVFPVLYRITSDPYGAVVRHHDTAAGMTPLTLAGASREPVMLSKEGYEDSVLLLPAEAGEVHASLRAFNLTELGGSSQFLSYQNSRDHLPVYFTAGATVLSGAAAAYFKTKADGYYNHYQQTGDQAAYDRMHRLDILSGFSLAASEIGLALLTYLLLSH